MVTDRAVVAETLRSITEGLVAYRRDARPVSAEVAEALRSIAEGIFAEGAAACRATPFDAVRVFALGIAAGAVMRAREGA